MKNRSISQWVAGFLGERRVRANSLIITIYGDSIAPHGGTVWLGSFIRLVESLGLNQRMVRTSVFRLAKEHWLVAEQRGRKSYYSLTATGRRRFEHAYRRIYDEPQKQWSGNWQMVLTTSGRLSAAQRLALRKDLLWEGYGIIAPGVLAHPSDSSDSLLDILQGNAAVDKVVVMQARTLQPRSAQSLHGFVHDCWNLEEISLDYRRYIDRFKPLLHTLQSAQALDPEQCFVVRTLLMHEFRRVLLRDPQLPAELLPSDWPGDVARQICRELYSVTQRATEQHLMEVLETADGPLPAAAAYFYERFGGVLSKNARP